jgi:hypothetical protein
MRELSFEVVRDLLGPEIAAYLDTVITSGILRGRRFRNGDKVETWSDLHHATNDVYEIIQSLIEAR